MAHFLLPLYSTEEGGGTGGSTRQRAHGGGGRSVEEHHQCARRSQVQAASSNIPAKHLGREHARLRLLLGRPTKPANSVPMQELLRFGWWSLAGDVMCRTMRRRPVYDERDLSDMPEDT